MSLAEPVSPDELVMPPHGRPSSAAPADPQATRWVGPLVAVLAVQAAATFLSRIAPTLAPNLADRLGWRAADVGYLSSLITGGSVVCLLLGLPLLRRCGSVRMLQLGLLLGAFGTLLCALRLPLGPVIGSLLIGFSMGPPSSAGSDVLQRFAPAGHRNLLFSIKQAGVPVGGILAGLTLPLLAESLGVEYAVVLSAGLAILTLLAVQPLRRQVDAGRDRTQRLGWATFISVENVKRPLAMLMALPAMRRLATAGACLSGVQSVWFVFLVTYAVRELHWTLTSAGALFALMQVASMIGRPLLGWISDRFDCGIRVLRAMAIGSAAATMALALTSPSWPGWCISALALLGGATVSGWNGVQIAEVVRHAPREALNDTTAGATLLLLAGFIAGPVIFGLLTALGGFRLAFGVTGLAGLAALWPLARAEERGTRRA